MDTAKQDDEKKPLFPLIGESREALHAKLVCNLQQVIEAEAEMLERQKRYQEKVSKLEENVRGIVQQLTQGESR
jgi:hypothetical protein